MLKAENYPNACKEIYVILKNMKKEDINKIPKSFINMIKTNMNDEYEFEINNSFEFEKINLLRETKAILAYIFLNYLGNKKQNEIINKKFENDSKNKEQTKYNSYDLFKNKINSENLQKNNKQKEIIKYEKENLFIKIINKLKNIVKS